MGGGRVPCYRFFLGGGGTVLQGGVRKGGASYFLAGYFARPPVLVERTWLPTAEWTHPPGDDWTLLGLSVEYLRVN